RAGYDGVVARHSDCGRAGYDGVVARHSDCGRAGYDGVVARHSDCGRAGTTVWLLATPSAAGDVGLWLLAAAADLQ
ncbi:hypothetical protein ACFVWG_15325, partial [Kribbella sp. NPDC058245]|uniref:hypothetical protein n=1 Tax=Kribbella sp. NPDC058245 TaxID=3346399 RepID=UPI0036F1412B